MEGHATQDEVMRKIDELIRVDYIPKAGSKTMQVFYETVAERYKQAIELANKIDVTDRFLELSDGEVVPLLEGLNEFYNYYTTLATFYSWMAKADELRSKYSVQLHKPEGLETVMDMVRAYINAMKALRETKVKYSSLLSHIKTLYLQTARLMLDVEKEAIALLNLKLAHDIGNLLFFHHNLYFEEMESMDFGERAQLFQLNQELYQDEMPMAELFERVCDLATKFISDKNYTPNCIIDPKGTKDAVARNIEMMGAIAKFYSIVATIPNLSPNATKEEMIKYYDQLEKTLSSALEVIKPYVDRSKGLRNLYEASQRTIENARKEKQKLSSSS